AAGPEGLGHLGPTNRPDRENHSAKALYRGRYFRRDPASRWRGGGRPHRCHQHRQERSDLRLRPYRHRHGRHSTVARIDVCIPRAAIAALARPHRWLGKLVMIEERFDAIVVGAGMGGNAAALTMAE